MQRPITFVRMLDTIGEVNRVRGLSGVQAGPGLQRGLFVNGQDDGSCRVTVRLIHLGSKRGMISPSTPYVEGLMLPSALAFSLVVGLSSFFWLSCLTGSGAVARPQPQP
jgi:hypothetical protein